MTLKEEEKKFKIAENDRKVLGKSINQIYKNGVKMMS